MDQNSGIFGKIEFEARKLEDAIEIKITPNLSDQEIVDFWYVFTNGVLITQLTKSGTPKSEDYENLIDDIENTITKLSGVLEEIRGVRGEPEIKELVH